MAVMVGVHGIGQQDSDPDRQWRLWSDSVRLGLAEARIPANMAPSLAVPFYGGLFRPGSEYLGWDDVPPTEDEAAFVAAAFDEAAAGRSDQEIADLVAAQEALGPPALAPPWLLRGLAVADHRWGRGSGWFLHRVLRQVYA